MDDFANQRPVEAPIAGGPPQDAGGPPQGIGGPPQGAGGPPAGMEGQVPVVDPVSGAWNMPGFGRSFATIMRLTRGYLPDAALWYLDIRNFRTINPNFGFQAGNYVLRELCAEIREFLCGDDLPIARLGADRFVALTANMSYDQAKDAFFKLLDEFNRKVKELGISQSFNLCAGIYYLREPDFASRSFNRAMDYASIAHRNARSEPQSSLTLFTAEDLERDNRRVTIEQTVDKALAEGEIEVWYQPQIDYTFGEIIGAEALARWNHPELGWISPGEFIPVLEHCGKIHDLDLYIWEEACQAAGRWHNRSDGRPVPISVNVSRAEMFETDLMDHFLELQAKYDLPPGSLHIEVTESAFVEEADRLYGIIEDMRKNHLLVEMDDFGNGLSSLNMLKDVKVDVVKLDMGFMRSAVNEDRGGVVLESVIRMLQGLDTPIIAEGVETFEQAEMLKNMGCHLMQGFHFSHPMPISEFEEFMAINNASETNMHRVRTESHLDELLRFDASSTYLFNEAIGGTVFFIIDGTSTESILVNDAFYEECGLERDAFGNTKINPIEEVSAESRATLWRAAAEAREKGSAFCRAQVRLTGRWFDGVMRYLGSSVRGNVYSLNIVRSGLTGEEESFVDVQFAQDAEWRFGLLDKIVPNGFVKCAVDDDLTIDYISNELVAALGFTPDEFRRRFHNSFTECVVDEGRGTPAAAVRAISGSDEVAEGIFTMHRGFGGKARVQLIGRVDRDADGAEWLYALIMIKDAVESDVALSSDDAEVERQATIPFDYYVADDRLVIRDRRKNGGDIVVERMLPTLESLPENITKSSAAKMLATLSDLMRHPTSGFFDIKCDFRGSGMLRWYHVNYTCDTDEQGALTAVHGYCQDADDRMGSAKWWRRQAEIDQLTGLLNRNAVEQRVNLGMRMQGAGMMFMVDLDGFKRVNDELGHLVGDSLLRDVAESLGEHFRESDVLGRYGGDEFVAFMPFINGEARQLAERRAHEIIAGIESIQIPDGTHAACSVGVALCRDREATFYDLLEAADKAMYESKLAGKGVYTISEM